jgi:peptidyl-prolyl cis-trans isomerase D
LIAKGATSRRKCANLPEREPLLQAAFATEIGADREALRTRDGYVWFDVTGIEPARERPLDEVRGEVESLWRSEEVARRLADKAREALERLNKGEAIETVATEAGQSVASAADLDRGSAAGALPQSVVTRIFATPVGKSESAPNRDQGRIVFKVTGATLPPLITTTQEAAATDEQLRTLLADDLVSQYVAEVQREVGVRVNQNNVRRAIGGES